jgi:BlaI family transcriptional regulator, penicillinase repressor
MSKHITGFEMKVLSALWSRNGEASVQDVLDGWESDDGKRPGYTTILKALQKLEAKGVVSHKAGEGRAYLYVAGLNRREASRGRLHELVDTVFGGDRLAFAHAFIDETPLSADEAAEIRRLLEEYEATNDR